MDLQITFLFTFLHYFSVIKTGRTKELEVDLHCCRPTTLTGSGQGDRGLRAWMFIRTINLTGVKSMMLFTARVMPAERVRSYAVQRSLLKTSFDSVLASDIFYVIIRWSSSLSIAKSG